MAVAGHTDVYRTAQESVRRRVRLAVPKQLATTGRVSGLTTEGRLFLNTSPPVRLCMNASSLPKAVVYVMSSEAGHTDIYRTTQVGYSTSIKFTM